MIRNSEVDLLQRRLWGRRFLEMRLHVEATVGLFSQTEF